MKLTRDASVEDKREYYRQYRLKNKEKIAAKNREWVEQNKDRNLAQKQRWYENNEAHNKLKGQLYYRENRKQMLAMAKRNLEKPEIRARENKRSLDRLTDPINKIKHKAHSRVNGMIRRGKLCAQPCLKCGSACTAAHHDSYLKEDWLKVKWLCVAHHSAWHRVFIAEI